MAVVKAGPDELPGRLLGGRYRIGAAIGRGGMGTVYAAVQESLGRAVAVKVLHPVLSQDAEAVTRFRAEAERAGGLSHPHIVHVLDFGWEEGGLAWIAMERLEGESLGQRIGRTGPQPAQQVVRIALETLSALEAAHEAKVVHRDLKPDNIFLTKAAGVGEVVKVLDFGIAKLLDGSSAASLTASGMVVGTPLYMSPEQAQAKPLDGRADLYSLGCVAFWALTGTLVFNAKNATAMMMRAVAALDAMRFTHTHDPELPGLPRLNVGSIIGGRGRDHNLRGAYTVSDFCTAYVNVRFNASQTGLTVVADIRRTLDALAAANPKFEYEIEFPPRLERGLGRLAKAAVDVPKTEAVVQMVRRNLRLMTGAEPEHFGVRLPQSYAGNDTTHLWAAGIPCCLYGPGGGYTDYHDVHVDLEDLFLCTRVLALTALEATL